MTQQTLESFANRHQCPTCSRDDFRSERAMRIHHAQTHGESLTQREDQYRCDKCGRKVQTKRGLSNHISKLHPEYWQEIQSEEVSVLSYDT